MWHSASRTCPGIDFSNYPLVRDASSNFDRRSSAVSARTSRDPQTPVAQAPNNARDGSTAMPSIAAASRTTDFPGLGCPFQAARRVHDVPGSSPTTRCADSRRSSPTILPATRFWNSRTVERPTSSRVPLRAHQVKVPDSRADRVDAPETSRTSSPSGANGLGIPLPSRCRGDDHKARSHRVPALC